MAAIMYSRTYVFDCQCKMLTNKERIIDLEKQKSSVQFELIDVLTRELKLNFSNLINEIIFFGDENINKIEKAYEVLFGEKDLKAFCSELITIIDDFSPQIENTNLESINGCGYE